MSYAIYPLPLLTDPAIAQPRHINTNYYTHVVSLAFSTITVDRPG